MAVSSKIKAKTTNKTKKTRKKRSKKKPINIFIQIIFFLFLIIALCSAYFIVLLSSSPRSISFLNSKIEKIINNASNQQIKIKDSTINITSSAKLRIQASNVKINSQIQKLQSSLPKIDIEIPISAILFGNFSPSKFIIHDANFTLNLNNKILNKNPNNNNNNLTTSSNIILPNKITDFFLSLKNKSHKNSIFEIKNSNLVIIDQTSSKNLFIKEAKITANYFDNKLIIEFNNELTIDQISNFNLESQCIFNKNNEIICNINSPNFDAQSFSWINPKLKILQQINAIFDIKAQINYKNNQLQNINFNATSTDGDFKITNFFDEKIKFNKLSTKGSYQQTSKTLEITKLNLELDNKNKTYQKYQISPKINISYLQNPNSQNITINLNNIAINELNKFWPSTLSKDSARDWSIKHLKNGLITQGNANLIFSQQQNSPSPDISDKISANLKIKDVDITYSKKFPKVTNLGANLKFDENSMHVNVTTANILDSKVSDSQIKIANFSDDNMQLEISANLNGHGSDILRHAAYKSNFAKFVKEYFNGQSQSKIKISLPLNEPINVKNIFIKTSSKITNNNNIYLQGNALINIEKPLSSANFALKINNSQAKLNCDFLGIKKDKNQESSLSLTANASDLDNIKLQNIIIKTANDTKKIIANLAFNTDPFKITKIDLSNSNFNNNNYHLNFNAKDKKLNLNAKSLNLADIINNHLGKKESKHSNSLDLEFNKLQVLVDQLQLANNNNFNDFYLFLDCVKGSCRSSHIKLKDQDKVFLEIKLNKENKNDYTTLNGKIFNIGKLVESLGISKLVENGKAKITGKNISKNGQFSLEGELEIYSPLTIFENEKIKLLQKDNLYSTIKDKIFSNNKTIFNRVKIEFELINKQLTIKSLIANNYKIGITAKGMIDFKNNIYNLEGFILPGYVINNLFGIGDIPILGEIANLLTGGKDGGVFGIKYQYFKGKNDKEFQFRTNKLSAIVPTSIQEMF